MSSIATDDLPSAAWWTALSCLPGMGPARLRLLWDGLGGPDAWDLVRRGGSHPPLAERLGPHHGVQEAAWAVAAREIDVGETWERHAAVGVHLLGDASMPPALAQDTEPPVVLFSAGDIGALEGPTVAVVGTRRCTRPGAETAREMGRELARAGVRVVSGLANGIDAAAHGGALGAGEGAAPPVAVVGTGLDVVYPPRSRDLWDQVRARGVVLSEYPLGTEPARWRFPARNRIVAALAQVTVVVESPERGGSMYTAEEALERGRTVLAVPGSIRSAASAGSNRLLRDGAGPACSIDDVLCAVGVSGPPSGDRRDRRPPATGDGRRILDVIGWEATTLDAVAARTGLGLGAIAVAVAALVAAGWVDHEGGRVERRAAS